VHNLSEVNLQTVAACSIHPIAACTATNAQRLLRCANTSVSRLCAAAPVVSSNSLIPEESETTGYYIWFSSTNRRNRKSQWRFESKYCLNYNVFCITYSRSWHRGTLPAPVHHVYVYVLMMGKNGGWYIVTLVFCINFPEKKVYDFSNCAIFCNFRCSFFIYELTDTPKGI